MRTPQREIVQGLFLVVLLLFIDFTSVEGSCSNGIAQILPVILYDMECEVPDNQQCFSNKMESPGQPGSSNSHLTRWAWSGSGPKTWSVVSSMEHGAGPYEQLGDRTTRFDANAREVLIAHFPGFYATQAQGFTASIWFKYEHTTNDHGIFFAIGGENGQGYSITIGRHHSTEKVRYTVRTGSVTTLEHIAHINVWHSTSFSIGPAPDFCWYITLDGNNICNCCKQASAKLYLENGINGGYNHAKILLGSFKIASGEAMTGYLDDVRVYNKVVSYQLAMSSTQMCICNAGYIGTTNCLACDAGTYKNVTGAGACLACDVGKHNNVTGAGACLACDVGKHKNVTGAGACSNCPIGKYSTISAATCTSCPSHYSATALTNAHLTQSSLGCIQFV